MPAADPAARGWYKLFKHMDDDGSGRISYAELEDMVRNELLIRPKELPDQQLKRLWRALDEDGLRARVVAGFMGAAGVQKTLGLLLLRRLLVALLAAHWRTGMGDTLRWIDVLNLRALSRLCEAS